MCLVDYELIQQEKKKGNAITVQPIQSNTFSEVIVYSSQSCDRYLFEANFKYIPISNWKTDHFNSRRCLKISRLSYRLTTTPGLSSWWDIPSRRLPFISASDTIPSGTQSQQYTLFYYNMIPLPISITVGDYS